MGGHWVPDVIHPVRGTIVTSKPVAQLLVDLTVTARTPGPGSPTKALQRVSLQDLGVLPAFPDMFGSLADSRAFGEVFFSYCNREHRHSGIGLHTPAWVHHGNAGQVRAPSQ